MRRADRLFQIIQILRRTNKPVTAAAMAAELEVSIRTVYRDMADLVGQRVPISGEPGLGYVLSADYDMPPLMLTLEELEAAALGAQWVAERGDQRLSLAARDVIAKLAAVIPENLRPHLVEPSTAVAPVLGVAEERIETSLLREAVRKGLKLRLRYRTQDGEESERDVCPVVLGYADNARVLIAWCELRQGFRHFRTDRIAQATLLERPIGVGRAELHRRWQTWRAVELDRYVRSP